MKDTRILGEKGRLTIPVQIRRALGLYTSTSVDIEAGKDDGILLVMKSRPHCITCGKVGRGLHPVGKHFICESCLNEANSSDVYSGEDITIKNVVDNYCINLDKIKAIKKENLEYEVLLQNAGTEQITMKNQTVSLEGNGDNEVQVQISYTVKEPTECGYNSVISFMNPNIADTLINKTVGIKFDMSTLFKKVLVIMNNGNYSFSNPLDLMMMNGIPYDGAKDIFDNWKFNSISNIKRLEDFGVSDTILSTELDKCYNMKLIKEVFPGISSQEDIDFILNCFIVSSSVKIKNV